MSKIVIDGRIIKSGTGNYVRQLVAHLEKLKTNHEFILLVRPEDINYWRPSTDKFQVLKAPFADYSFGEQLGFKHLLDELQPDLVHFCMPQQPILYKGKTVTTIHDLNLIKITETDDMHPIVFRIKQRIFRWLLNKVAHKSAHIITPSEFTKQDLVEFSGVNESKISVTYEAAGIAVDKEKPVASLKGKSFIMYQGRAEPYKNNRGLIKAHQLLLSQFPELQLVLVGKKDAYRTADENWVKQQGFKNVVFTGFISDAESTWLYRNCKAYVFPSFMEGFGLPALEAMSAGAPVVTSDATCLPEICANAALYFDAHSPEDIAQNIAKVIKNQNLADDLRKKGFARAQQFSWQRMAEQTLSVYDDVLLK